MSARPGRAGWMLALLGGLLAAPALAQSARPSGPNDQARWADRCAASDEWDKAGPPFRIHGNSFYVGTCGIAAILVTGEEGHILIDGGTAAGADLIARNIEALGFRMSDVKLLLHSHEHFDHVGGLAKLQRRTGAPLLASPQAAPVLASGKAASDDPQYSLRQTFSAVQVRGTVQPGEAVRIGNLALTPISTPGHTSGALSWRWQACEGEDCRTIVYADSLSPVSSDDYRFSNHPAYLNAFRASLERVAGLDCTILLTPHPSASGMRDRLLNGSLDDPAACRAYAESIRARLEDRLTEESRG